MSTADASRYSLGSLFSVEGSVVVITGGGTGIGRMITTAFAMNGAKVYITGRRSEVLEKTSREINEMVNGKGSVVPIQGDVSSKATVKEFYNKVAEKENRIDTLINCAGISKPWRKPTTELTNVPQVQDMLDSVEDEDFSTSHSINVAGPYFTTIAFAPLLAKSENASVIIIASIAPFVQQKSVGPITYSVSKGGAVTLSHQLASRLIPYKIRVNCLCPGIFPSEMTGDGTNVNPAIKALLPTIPKGREGKAEEIAGPCVMLASPAGAYMNNAVLTIDGGRLMTC
ncbi:hypothetical protein HD553DRAFT_41516 [Filobasidium floriforme]|uniref:uncharacterized protein n=1 Tax=Filobasidium floriforme TaxID=5210 RepID=UPI001E8E6E05|nr:uncharacterized protein HD553DRAFT_41516 [Filobasidium floriforme]KAH8084130.1 hypothetical protein HD553DRAFT_41516 [Filobasidium floriforme]